MNVNETTTRHHVFGQPAIVLGSDAGKSQSHALLAEECVSPVSTPEGKHLVIVGNLGDEHFFRVARPAVYQFPWKVDNVRNLFTYYYYY